MEDYIIKKYANRKLYDVQEKKYINLYGIARLIREAVPVKVIDNQTGEELTSIILAQIIVEQERTKQKILPSFLSPLKILQSGGESMFKLGKEMLLAGIGLASLSREKANQIARRLIEKGELSQSESKDFVVDLLDRAEKEKDLLIEKIRPEITQQLDKMNLASKSDVTRLEEKLDRLEKQLNEMSKKKK